MSDSLIAIRDLHETYGHIQEVIVQNFRAKSGTPMALSPEPNRVDMLRTLAVTRLLMPRMNIQAPPNLSDPHYADLLDGGINDWGGVSPLTPDFINPERPWPHLEQLRQRTEAKGFELRQRLPVYPEFVKRLEDKFAESDVGKRRFADTTSEPYRGCSGLCAEGGVITVLTGGTGGAKFVDGLRQIIPPEELTIIVNTGDDLRWWGLYVSPDVDSITYGLAGKLSEERGWGVQRDTFLCLQSMKDLGQPAWFSVGDRDLATHLFRSQMLAEGKTLTEATSEIATRLGVKTRILPMSDSRVETRVLTSAGELSFEEYFVKRRFQDPVKSVRFDGASEAQPAPPECSKPFDRPI